MSRFVDGRAIARTINQQTALELAKLQDDGVVPTLAVVVPTDDQDTAAYVRSLSRTAERLGITCLVDTLDNPSDADLARRLAELSADDSVHGIICQTPLPPGISLVRAASFITPTKDVDGANPVSLGSVTAGLDEGFAPATASAVVEILRHEGIEVAGRRVVILGRSNIVGKPAAMLLVALHATVTICHSRSKDIAAICQDADIIVAATGTPHLVDATYVRQGAVVIDVGTTVTPEGNLVGDVNTEDVAQVASVVTPVPGGVGPVTTALLMRNAVTAARNLTRSPQR
ncbi:bifunctional 5,10-methylenetetrahydrofolate dehydrogenase/5,10-methenyltetrahydrofolate cyclohydrolase [Actinopolymorpha alba]|uniref:bifunctional 5,10-methylenetetrahydrofolate dehydrogenase/5,10-methenyltetrahydrofolate cyclohydrolase n=1 Tax=Actinopolymorpha alba TaxID=533267 RepID=UPI000368918F|nr:bifunctional 5,10-methylenetetrahydrofolate dehydrogenase/5,10-methenyltetrahydrofolate cyclohydrolase [Actinopolymorpha alba]